MGNIAEPLFQQCRQRPAATVMLSPRGKRDRAGQRVYHAVTFGDLAQRIRRLTAALGELGIRRGDRCALMVPPSIEFVELTFALFAAGAVPVFVDPGIGLKNLKACLREAEPTAFLGITKAHIARLLFGWAKSSLRTLVTVGPKFGWGGTTLQRMRTATSATADIAPTQDDDLAAILFTSGSTGVPKGAVYTHGMFLAQLEKLRLAFDIQPGEVDLCTFPLFALFGPALGMTSVIPVMDATKPAQVHPQEIVQPVQQWRATNLFGSPALLNRVGRAVGTGQTLHSVAGFARIQPSHENPLNSGESSYENSRLPADEGSTALLPTLKRVLSAGAPVSPSIMERFQSLLNPGTQIYTPYGATEALPVAVIGSTEVLSDTRHQTANGAGTCVGRPVEGLDVRIIRISDEPIAAWSDDLLLPTGEIGEIVVYGPQVTQEYFRRPDLTALAKIPDAARGRRWHRMGDVGYFDASGRLWFCGRKSQRVVCAERTWFTDPVEGIFNAQPGIFRTALVGVQQEGGMVPVLCVEREPGSRETEAKVRQSLLEVAQAHEVTRGLTTLLFHAGFPVDIRHNSKIFREKLAVWAAEQLQSRGRA